MKTVLACQGCNSSRVMTVTLWKNPKQFILSFASNYQQVLWIRALLQEELLPYQLL